LGKIGAKSVPFFAKARFSATASGFDRTACTCIKSAMEGLKTVGEEQPWSFHGLRESS